MSNAKYCWFCSGLLVGPGGVKGKEPLFFKLVKTQDDLEVRVHVGCVGPAERYIRTRKITASPPLDNRKDQDHDE